MDANLAKHIAYVAAGFIAGGTVGFLIVRKIETDKIDAQIAAENEELAKSYRNEFTEEQLDQALDDGSAPTVLNKMTPGKSKVDKAKLVDYTKFAKISPASNKPLKDVAKEKLGDDIPQDAPTFSIISFDDFMEDGSGNEKVSLTFWSKDETLEGEDGEIIMSFVDMIGDALLHFGEKSNDPDSVYFRNDNTSTDYEISRVHKSYSETVLGIIPDKDTRKGGSSKRKSSRPPVQKVDDDDADSED